MGFCRRLPILSSAALCVWACATGEDPTDSDDGAGRGGTAGTIGTGGSLFGGAGFSGGFVSGAAGGAGRGGAGTGAEPGSAGEGGAPGEGGSSSGGKGGTGGMGGSVGVPPDVLARASVVLHYQTNATAPQTNRIFMRLFIENKAPDPLPMANVTVRYWMTSEIASPNVQDFFAGPNIANQTERYVEDGADSHVEISFTGNTIPRGADLNQNEFQLQVEGGALDQSDDYSFEPAFMTRQPHDRITVYLLDRLIWGCEPSGRCFGDGGEGGAGGGGAGGEGGSPGGTSGTGGTLGGSGGSGGTTGAGTTGAGGNNAGQGGTGGSGGTTAGTGGGSGSAGEGGA